MRRREFVTLVGGAAAASCAGPFAAFAQAPAKRPRIVYLGASLPGPAAKTTAAFIEGMGALGYTEGHDFTMEYRWAEGHVERLPALAQELVRRGTDVILPGNGQAAVAARDATKAIPIVCPLLDIGLLVNPATIANLNQRQEMETAAATMGVRLIPIETRTPEPLDPVFPTLARERVDAVIVLRAGLFFVQRRTIAAAALAARLPTIYAQFASPSTTAV